VDAECQRYNLGEEWWDPAIKSNPSLTLQRPLLDGGEGKSITSNKNKISIPVDHKDHEAQVDGVQEDMVSDDKGDTPPESTSLQGIRGLSPRIILTGALAHMATTEEAVTDTTFTPCSLLRRCNLGEDNNMRETDLSGLELPTLEKTGGVVTGADTPQHRIENKQKRKAKLAAQPITTQWTIYKGEFDLPQPLPSLSEHSGEMCPSGLALHHPVANLLKEWATYGCPTKTGKARSKSQMQEAVDQGPHPFALSDKAIAHFQAEVTKKVRIGQAKLVAWDTIKDNPPGGAKNLSYCCNTPQIKAVSIDPRFVLPSASKAGGNSPGSKCNHY
jgi:hypothetical protein